MAADNKESMVLDGGNAVAWHLRQIIAMSAAIALVGCSQADSSKPRLAAVSVDRTTTDFGTVWASPNFNWVVTIANTTGHVQVIDELRGNCRCLSLPQVPMSIPPFAEAQLPLVIDKTNVGANAIEPFAVQIDGLVTESSPGIAPSSEDFTIAITGYVRSPVTLEPPRLTFAANSDSEWHAVRGTIKAFCPADVIGIQIGHDRARYVRASVEEQDERQFFISADVRTDVMPTESFVDLLDVFAVRSDGTILGPVPLEIDVSVPKLLQAFPSVLHITSEQSGNIRRTIELQASGRAIASNVRVYGLRDCAGSQATQRRRSLG